MSTIRATKMTVKAARDHEAAALASADRDFERVQGPSLYRPADLA